MRNVSQASRWQVCVQLLSARLAVRAPRSAIVDDTLYVNIGCGLRSVEREDRFVDWSCIEAVN